MPRLDLVAMLTSGRRAYRRADGPAEDMAGKLADVLEGSPEFKQWLVDAVISAEKPSGRPVKARSKNLYED